MRYLEAPLLPVYFVDFSVRCYFKDSPIILKGIRYIQSVCFCYFVRSFNPCKKQVGDTCKKCDFSFRRAKKTKSSKENQGKSMYVHLDVFVFQFFLSAISYCTFQTAFTISSPLCAATQCMQQCNIYKVAAPLVPCWLHH